MHVASCAVVYFAVALGARIVLGARPAAARMVTSLGRTRITGMQAATELLGYVPLGALPRGPSPSEATRLTGGMWFLRSSCPRRRREQIQDVHFENISYIPQAFISDTFAAPLDTNDHVPAKLRFQGQGFLGERTLEAELSDARADLPTALLPSLLVFKKRLGRSRRHTQWHLNGPSMSAPLVRHEIHITVQ